MPVMDKSPLQQAIIQQGKMLQSRADWLQKMIERNMQAVLNNQKTIEHFSNELAATNMAIDALRDEYKTSVGE